MKFGLISRLKVVCYMKLDTCDLIYFCPADLCKFDLFLFCMLIQGHIQEKAKILQSVRVNDVRTTQLQEIIDTLICFVQKISDLTCCYL